MSSKFGALRLEDIIDMEFAEFVSKFKNKMLPTSLDKYISLKLQTYTTPTLAKKLKTNFIKVMLELILGKRSFCQSAFTYGKIFLWKIAIAPLQDFRKNLNKDVWLNMTLKLNLS